VDPRELSAEIARLEAVDPVHPYFSIPTPERRAALGEAAYHEALVLREEAIFLEKENPLAYGVELPIWKIADSMRAKLREKIPKGVIIELNLGGNRSAKSKRAAKRVVQAAIKKPGSRIWCCDSTESMSRANQQRFIYEFLPPQWKKYQGRDAIRKIKYSVADGFTGNGLVCPNKSEINFKFYSQDLTTLPGPELDMVWADELLPLPWLDVLTFRLTNRDGILHITFTPELHWSETVAYFLEGAQTLAEEPAKLLPKVDKEGCRCGFEMVPRIQQGPKENIMICYFYTSDNPYGNPASAEVTLKNKPRKDVLMRYYGVVTKAFHCAFPTFNKNVHVISQDLFHAIETKFKDGERYMLVDPCSGRNWFITWVFCPCPDRWIVYREWPSPGQYIEGIGDPQDWTVSSHAADGARGPAQDTFGFGLMDYKREIEHMEKDEKILERWIDARYAATPTQTTESVTTLIEQLADIGMDFRSMTIRLGSIFGAGPQGSDGSIDMIDTALAWDPETPLGEFSGKLARMNEPQLQFVENCKNTIYSMSHWTGIDGQRGAAKDPVDNLRGMFLSRIGYIGKDAYVWKGGRAA
jgi:hypothetical protein